MLIGKEDELGFTLPPQVRSVVRFDAGFADVN